MNIVTMCVLGFTAGVFIPFAAEKTSAYKLMLKGKELSKEKWRRSWWLLALSGFAGALGFAFCSVFLSDVLPGIIFCAVWLVVMTVILVDIYIRIVPNEAVLILLILGAAYQFLLFGLLGLGTAFLTMLAVMLLMLLIARFLGFAQIGAGDVKLAAAMALTLGYPYVLDAFLVMAILMGVFCVGGIASNKLTRYSLFPYAPFIGSGFLAGMAFMHFNFWALL